MVPRTNVNIKKPILSFGDISFSYGNHFPCCSSVRCGKWNPCPPLILMFDCINSIKFIRLIKSGNLLESRKLKKVKVSFSSQKNFFLSLLLISSILLEFWSVFVSRSLIRWVCFVSYWFVCLLRPLSFLSWFVSSSRYISSVFYGSDWVSFVSRAWHLTKVVLC